VTVLRTFSTSCNPIYDPLRALGNDVRVIVYDLMNVHNRGDYENHYRRLTTAGYEVLPDARYFERLPALVDSQAPDWVLMIGCCDAGGALMPNVDVLAEIGRRRPFVHLCCDGSEKDWWPQLQRYHDAGCFALQVNIDGVKVGPIGEHGMTALCPISPAGYPDPPRPWAERPVRLGFRGSYQLSDPPPGGYLHPRTPAIRSLLGAGLLTISDRDHTDPSQAGYRDFLSQCRCVWNHAATGSGDRMHVKARVIETALAGALLIEPMGSPTEEWFKPGLDYLPYSADSDGLVPSISHILKLVDAHSHIFEMANILRRKVLTHHSPAAFWGRVLEHLVQRQALDLAEPMGHA
jgi:hypothetical protein